jgi:hypothetical protein
MSSKWEYIIGLNGLLSVLVFGPGSGKVLPRGQQNLDLDLLVFIDSNLNPAPS